MGGVSACGEHSFTSQIPWMTANAGRGALRVQHYEPAAPTVAAWLTRRHYAILRVLLTTVRPEDLASPYCGKRSDNRVLAEVGLVRDRGRRFDVPGQHRFVVLKYRQVRKPPKQPRQIAERFDAVGLGNQVGRKTKRRLLSGLLRFLPCGSRFCTQGRRQGISDTSGDESVALPSYRCCLDPARP